MEALHRTHTASQRGLLEKADQYLVGGCLGMFHLPRDVGFVVKRGSGSKIFDVEGNSYIDYVLGSGPLILGHAHPAVVKAVQHQTALVSTCYTLTEPTIELAEKMVAAVPCAEAVRFVSSGTEGTFYALRIARASAGREKILKFEGGWHGGSDYAQQSAAPSEPGGYPRPQTDSAGIPRGATDAVLVAPFNDLEATQSIIEEHHAHLAAVILEPLQRVIKPDLDFLRGLREITRRYEIVLIFDEVVTGFRLAWGGAQEWYGVVPDLAVYGKTISGGHPIAAICGRREIMAVVDPGRKGSSEYAFMSGTFNGNPISTAAGLATLRVLGEEGTYERLHAIGDQLRQGAERLGQERAIPIQAPGDGPVLQVLFTEHKIVDYRSTLTADREKGYRFGLELLKRGIFVTPGGKFYLSIAHTDEDLDRTLELFEDALRVMG